MNDPERVRFRYRIASLEYVFEGEIDRQRARGCRSESPDRLPRKSSITMNGTPFSSVPRS